MKMFALCKRLKPVHVLTLIFSVLVLSLFAQALPLMDGRVAAVDPTTGQIYKSSIGLTNGTLNFVNGLNSTNGLSVSSGTVNFTGTSTFTIPDNLIDSDAISTVLTSSGASDEGKIAELDSTGKFASGFIPITPPIYNSKSTNSFHGSSASTWEHVASLDITTTSTTGLVCVIAHTSYAGDTAIGSIRIRDQGTNWMAGSTFTDYADSGAVVTRYFATTVGWDRLTGSSKTYSVDVAAQSGGVFTNASPSAVGASIDNGPGVTLQVIEYPVQ